MEATPYFVRIFANLVGLVFSVSLVPPPMGALVNFKLRKPLFPLTLSFQQPLVIILKLIGAPSDILSSF